MLDTNIKAVEKIETTNAGDADVVFEIGDVRDTKGGPGNEGDGGNGLFIPM